MIGVGTPIPAPTRVRELFTDLLDRPVDVRPGAPFRPEPGRPTAIAVYVDASLTLRLVAVADLAFAAYAATSIGLLPVGEARLALREGALPLPLEENLHEVLHVCAALLNGEGLPHVGLHAVHHLGTVAPAHVQATACTLGRRLDLVVDISGYGEGRFSLVGLP